MRKSRARISIQQRTKLDVQGHGQLLHDENGRVAGATLQIADVGSVQAGFERKLLLRPALELS